MLIRTLKSMNHACNILKRERIAGDCLMSVGIGYRAFSRVIRQMIARDCLLGDAIRPEMYTKATVMNILEEQ